MKTNTGFCFTDLTTLYSVDALLKDPSKASDFQFLDLCSLIDTMILSKNICVLEPVQEFEKLIPVKYPDLFFQLEKKNIKIKKLPYPVNTNIDEDLLILAKELRSDPIQMKYLRKFGKNMDTTGYFTKYFKELSKKPIIGKLNNHGYMISDGSIYGLGHYYRLLSYLNYSWKEKIPYMPHYIRGPIIKKSISHTGNKLNNFLIGKDIINKIEDKIKGFKEYYSTIKPISIEPMPFPAIPTYILSQCNHHTDIIDEVCNVTKSWKTKRFQELMARYGEASMQDTLKANQYKNKINDYIDSLDQKLIEGLEIQKVIPLIIRIMIMASGILKKYNPIILLELIYKIMETMPELYQFSDKVKTNFQLSFLGSLYKGMNEISSSTEVFENVFKRDINLYKLNTFKKFFHLIENFDYMKDVL